MSDLEDNSFEDVLNSLLEFVNHRNCVGAGEHMDIFSLPIPQGDIFIRRTRLGAVDQIVTRYPNGYGASIICGPGTYGFPDSAEVGVVKFDGDVFDLTYSTPITDDVMGSRDAEEVMTILSEIQALPKE